MISLQKNIRPLDKGNWLLDENLNNSFFSGNKIRKLNGILKNIKEPEGLITIGSTYSSHCLATSYFGAYHNIPVVLIIITQQKIDTDVFPHLRMAEKLGAKLFFISEKEAYNFIELKKKEFIKFLWIPGGGHTADAAKEYETLIIELFQNKKLNNIEKVLLPFGTGTTALGIFNGLKKLNLNSIDILGVSVSRDAEKCINALQELLKNESFDKLQIIEDYCGKYHIRSKETESARILFFKKTGVLVDPIYNAKALEVFFRYELKNTLIINTGGMLNNLS